MREDAVRLLLAGLSALLIGWFSGHLTVALLVAACIALVWQTRDLHRLLRWVRHPKRTTPPSSPGIFTALVDEIDDLRERNKSRKKRLSRYLKQFRRATAALPDATVVLDSSGTIEWANGAAVRLLNVRWPRDARQRITHLVRHPELARLLEAGEADGSGLEIQAPHDPSIELSIRVAPYEQGNRLLVARDVSRLHQLNQMRKDFVANVSHELRSPLTVLRGYLEMLTSDAQASAAPEVQRALEEMEHQTLCMQGIVDDLLLLARLEHGEERADDGRVAVAEMLAEIRSEAVAASGASRHRFVVEADPRLAITGNARELHSAFANLVLNAVRYTPDAGCITLRWYGDDEGAHLRVEDTGVGIPPEHIPRLTERFYRVDQGRSRERGGTGLGLAIVKHVLDHHQARLRIESEPGKGSQFCCDFPPKRIYPAVESGSQETS